MVSAVDALLSVCVNDVAGLQLVDAGEWLSGLVYCSGRKVDLCDGRDLLRGCGEAAGETLLCCGHCLRDVCTSYHGLLLSNASTPLLLLVSRTNGDVLRMGDASAYLSYGPDLLMLHCDGWQGGLLATSHKHVLLHVDLGRMCCSRRSRVKFACLGVLSCGRLRLGGCYVHLRGAVRLTGSGRTS